MNLANNNGSSKIKRRNFFLYLGASVIGVVALAKSPFSLFKSKLNSELNKTNKLSVRANPYAIKRTNEGAKNG